MRKPSLPLWFWAAALFVFLYAPIAVVIVYSFNSARHGGPWQGFTTDWYGKLFDSQEKIDAAKNTLILGLSSTGIATVLGTLLGYGLSRYRFPGKKLFSRLMYIPVVIPDIVMAIAMLMFFSLVRDHLGLFELGMTTMIVAHVTLPMILPAVVAGAMLAFTLSLDDFVVSFFTTGPGAGTLPILIYSSVKRGITPDINALSTLIVLVSVIGTLAGLIFERPRRTSGES